MAGEPEDAGAAAWLDKAEEDLEAARVLLGASHWAPAAFHAHQVAEKALKAVQVLREHGFEKTHDLVWLARRVKAPPRVEEHAALLYEFYTTTRYPDAAGHVPEASARDAVTRAEEVLRWAQTQRL